ncbi:1320_t:CDS:2 [Dentiscutata heterogama]|uniref:1320_t:CDS:1 n=1 Tax=Dentiscutata heterogama TaxID=1316150 RepID=A0ACA9JYI6_9GLOM|nr:1320_t:CDS:2 [Dentiscutata heterogama]
MDETGLFYSMTPDHTIMSCQVEESKKDKVKKLDVQINGSNHHILLILDNATSHAIGTLSLTNVEILFLPKNTTSKIQPIDTVIITSFKLRYGHLQLQHAIDRNEAGENDIYKVDQLQGMRWAKIAWNEVTVEMIKNC